MALRKHGVEPLIGHIESVIDPKFFAPVAWVEREKCLLYSDDPFGDTLAQDL